jgi:hypothetical protein
MQVKLGELKNAEMVLSKLAQAQLPMKTSFSIAKLIRASSEDLKDFEGKRIVLVKKYGDQKEDGNVQVKPENIEAFLNEMRELTDITLNIDVERIKLSDLQSLQFSAIELSALEPFIEDDVMCKVEKQPIVESISTN